MSLVGRLEDLSPSDIIQIVFLSRRSGRLEMRVTPGTYSIHFSHGLIAGVSSPASPDLASSMLEDELLSDVQLAEARRIESQGIPLGTVLVDCNILSPAELVAALERRIGKVLDQIAGFTEGEFDFVLAPGVSAPPTDYDLIALIGAEGYFPQRFLGVGEKLKPLQGLEDSMRAGKAFLRGIPTSPGAEDSVASQDAPASDPDSAPATPGPAFDPEPTRPALPASQFRIRDDGAADRSELRVAVLVYEPEPLLRVALKRALSSHGNEILQSYSVDECRREMARLVESRRFFVSIVDVSSHSPSGAGRSLVSLLKRTNPQLPVAVIGDASSTAGMMQLQPDEVITLPVVIPPERYDISPAVEALSAFVREEVDRWMMSVAASGSGAEAGVKFYEQAQAERTSRRFELLELLIMELSDPEDVLTLGRTLLRAGSEYVDRGAIFVAGEEAYMGLAGFGSGGVEEVVNDSIKGARIPFSEPSVLRDVAAGRRAHRGKLRKTPANVELVQRLGQDLPSEVVVLPIARGNTVVGVFYGDNGGSRTPISETAGLEIFLGQAGRALEEGLNARAARIRRGGEGC